MATYFQEEGTQHSLRIGDTVLLYARKTKGFVFSELTRYDCNLETKMYNTLRLSIFLLVCSEQHNSVALFHSESLKDPKFPNIHCTLDNS